MEQGSHGNPDIDALRVRLQDLQFENEHLHAFMEVVLRNGPFIEGKPAYGVLDIRAAKNGDRLNVMWQDITEKKRQEAEIHRLNAELAQRVTEQTTQLETMVQELSAQIAERERNATRAEVLTRIAARLNAQLDLSAVQHTVCEESTKALRFSSAIIALLNPATQTALITTTYGLPAGTNASNRIRSVDEYIRRFALQHSGDPLVINDVQSFSELPDAKRFRELDIRTLMGVGMYREDQLIGVLVLFSIGETHQVNQHDLTLLKAFADQAALAISNARLYEEEQERAAELSTLLTLSSRLRESQSANKMLPAMLYEIHTLLKVDACMVAMLNPHDKSYTIALADGYLAQNINLTFQITEGISGVVLSTGVPVVTHDYPIEPNRLTGLQNVDQVGPAVFIPIRHETGQMGALAVTRRRQETSRPFTPTEVRLLTTVGEMLGTALRKARLFDDLQQANIELIQAYDATIKGWSHALDLRDKETEDHTQRVTDLTERLAQEMDIHGEALVHIRRGAILHDIGKMGIPDSILLKPAPLTADEWDIMRRHPQYAYEMLWPIQYLRPALDIPYCHHEWWNGHGYPRGLRAEQIPVAARIFAVVDVWDALSVDRPYRKAWPEQQVRAYLVDRAGTQFDPAVVQKFLGMMSDTGRTIDV